VQPQRLVTWGPYAYVQHPIYVSYTLLFSGTALLLHSFRAGLLMLGACLLYYSQRTMVEAAMLRRAFGGQYIGYAACTARCLPGVY
jgi:protein-S-isoprenylcysteine O-methyltransferase Ste14